MTIEHNIPSNAPTYCFNEWLKGLNCSEKTALDNYKDCSQELKAMILGKDQDKTHGSRGWEWKNEHLFHLDAAISRLKHHAGLSLWCAIADGQNMIDALNEGIYHYKPYISTSRYKESSYKFFSSPVVYQPYLLQFNMNKDFCGAQFPLQENAGDGEYEIVLPRNRSYQVVSAEEILFSEVRPAIKRYANKMVKHLQLEPIPM